MDLDHDPSEYASQNVPRYHGEDCRPTSRKELLGFYAYSCAVEVVVIAAVSSFVPITLEELARGHGVLQSDRATPCNSPASGPHQPQEQCLIRFLGAEINTASFAMYTFSFSVLLQALIVITMSGAADHGSYRKTLLLGFAIVGSIALMLFLPIDSNVFGLGALWAVIINVCLGASAVLLNAYLPLLVRWHPTINEKAPMEPAQSYDAHAPQQDFSTGQDESLLDEAADRLLPSAPTSHPATPTASPELQLSTRISANGIGFGYLAALLVQLLAIAIVIATGSKSFSLRLVLFIVGLWWLILSIPAAYCLRPRPGPPLYYAERQAPLGGLNIVRSWLGYMTYSWKKLGRSILRARRLKDVLLFLAAWFMISDAIATVSGTAILFAKTTLGMHPAALSMINVIATCFGVIGAFSWSKISHLLQLTPTKTIFACICLFEVIPMYGLLGYLPFIRNAGVFGLQQAWEMYPLGAIYGFVLGGLSSHCRSLFGELIPEGSEATFYALYAVTDKGSSVFGPAVVGAITDATGEIRPAFWFLAVLIGVPLLPLMFIDVARGKREGAALGREIIAEEASSMT